jgi:hypothetical protein
MDTILGLLGIVVWIGITIAIAAAVTWLVVKLFPEKSEEPAPRGSDA